MSGFRIIRYSNVLITEFIQGTLGRACSDLPDDVEFVGVVPPSAQDVMTSHVRFLLRSDEWEPVLDGTMHPEITPTYTSEDQS